MAVSSHGARSPTAQPAAVTFHVDAHCVPCFDISSLYSNVMDLTMDDTKHVSTIALLQLNCSALRKVSLSLFCSNVSLKLRMNLNTLPCRNTPGFRSIFIIMFLFWSTQISQHIFFKSYLGPCPPQLVAHYPTTGSPKSTWFTYV